MKLHLSILEKLIDLPVKDPIELRHVLDDIGLEVKGIEGAGQTTIYNIETLANRGDTLSALGVAREFAARYLTAVKLPPISGAIQDRKASVGVRRNTPKCLRYGLLELALPKGMQLRSDIAAVMGPLASDRHAIVEILNYLWLEIGQPMHAFDKEKIEGEISIDTTEREEEIKALDGKSYKVPAGSIVIRDRKKIVAVAGVIGCENSMVTPDTTRVLIESATFDPVSIRLTRRAMGISTDASYTFERGSDVDAVHFSLQRLVYLAGAAGGAANDGNTAQVVGLTSADAEPTERRKVTYSIDTLRKEMNLPRLNEVEINSRLKHLGFGIEPAGEDLTFHATVPSWRLWDIRNPEDITEEVARVVSLNKVKLALPPLDYEAAELDPTEIFLERVEPALHGYGFSEVITKGFSSADEVRIMNEIDPQSGSRYIGIKNAVESNYSHLKQTNVLHLARVCEQNLRRGVESVKVYEYGRLFSRVPQQESRYEFERDTLTLAAAGRWIDNRWRKAGELEDLIFSFKGVLDAIAAGLSLSFISASSARPFLHPGMQATIRSGRTEVGFFGVIHPLLQERTELSDRMLYAELDVERLAKLIQERTYTQAVDLPAVWRDITLKVAPRALAEEAIRFIEESKPEHLQRVHLVDTFKKSDETFRRVSYRLIFQSAVRTLESAEVDAQMTRILGQLKEKHGLELAV